MGDLPHLGRLRRWRSTAPNPYAPARPMANNTITMTGSATPAAVGTVALPGTAGAFGGSAAGAFGASPDWATAASASGARVAMTLAPGWVRVTARLAGVAGARAVARAAGVAVPDGVAGAPGTALGPGAGSIVARGAAGAPLAVAAGWAVTLSTARVAGATGAGDDCPVGVAARVLVGAGIGLGVGVELQGAARARLAHGGIVEPVGRQRGQDRKSVV